MKQIITCICLMFTTAMIAQTTPTRSSEARKTNMSKMNARTGISKVTLGSSDGPAASTMKGNFGISAAAVDGGVEIKDFAHKNSSARAAKMKKGDIITAINSKTVDSPAKLSEILATFDLGDVVTVHYKRGTRTLSKEVRIGR